jgi:hypothetical protein
MDHHEWVGSFLGIGWVCVYFKKIWWRLLHWLRNSHCRPEKLKMSPAKLPVMHQWDLLYTMLTELLLNIQFRSLNPRMHQMRPFKLWVLPRLLRGLHQVFKWILVFQWLEKVSARNNLILYPDEFRSLFWVSWRVHFVKRLFGVLSKLSSQEL